MTKKYLLLLLSLFSLFNSLFSSSTEITLGGDEGWNNYSVLDNISIANNGKFGKSAIELSSESETVKSTTDLLIDFEDGDATDISGNYYIVDNNLIQTTNTIMGKESGLGKGSTGGLVLHGNENSIFGSQGTIGSFTISFWLNPSLSAHGETIFLWDSSRTINDAPIYQYISVMFYQNKMEWNFSNVFSDYFRSKDITVRSSSVVVPDAWAHHSLSFDEKTGLIEYRINGKIESIAYATASGIAGGNVYIPMFGMPDEITICSNYTGRVDDFSIKKEFTEPDFNLSLFSTEGGYYVSQPLGPFPDKTILDTITSVADIPNQTDVQLFVRSGDNVFEWNDVYPEWIPVVPNQQVTNSEGIWHQVAIALYPDGAGNKTPTVTEVTISFLEEDAPMAPVKVFADAADGYVDLSWLPSAGTSPDGYLVYYGEKSGEYLGDSAIEGSSPIDAGNTQEYRISGLKNGKAYYFAIAAYSDNTTRTQGFLSEEVYARPLKGK